MAISSISRIQHRRGLLSDLPTNLNEGEFGWCLDTRQLFIGNGPGYGLNTQVLTQYSPNGQLITNQFKTPTTSFINAIQRPLGSKLDDIASVKDFGATGLGIVDDSITINTAISSLLQGPYSNPIDRTRNVALKLPAGTYLLDAEVINLFPYVTLVGDGPGNTILLAAPGTDLNLLFHTVDSLGQITTNIGLNGAVLPHKIVLRDMTINTNGQPISAVHLNRANNVRFENVEFIGGYVLGNDTDQSHTAIKLQSLGNAIGSYNFQFVGCFFYNFTYALYVNDPVTHTGIANCVFSSLYRGLNIGENYNYFGPSWTVVSGSEFDIIDDSGIIIWSPNPGVTSTGNTFHNVGAANNVLPIVWNTGTTLNTSVADIFDSGPGVLDNGIIDLILDAQQTNVNTLIGPTGATGPADGPTGPTGVASTVTGPTGAAGIGPTGPIGAAATGPTGPIAATGPTGPSALVGAMLFTSSGIFTVPFNVTKVWAELWGGGGGATGGDGSSGAGGGYCAGFINTTPGTNMTVTCGAAGLAVAAPGTATTGGTTSFGGLQATGGTGGGPGPGPGGIGIGGIINIQGQPGTDLTDAPGNTSYTAGMCGNAIGGNSPRGGMGGNMNASGPPGSRPATAPGGGGGSNAAQNGYCQNGAVGWVAISWA